METLTNEQIENITKYIEVEKLREKQRILGKTKEREKEIEELLKEINNVKFK